MAQWLRFGLYLSFIPFAIPIAAAAAVCEAVTGNDPLAPEGDGIARNEEAAAIYQRRRERCKNNCT